MSSSVRPESDPDEPRAPPTEVWRRLSPEARAALIERLGPTPRDLLPPVGDPHIDAERLAEDSLGGWFRRRRTRAYIGRGITVYYPDEPRFDPDLFVVFDVEPGQRMSWIVDHEGRGLDFVLEILDQGDRRKDLEGNVERYARLGVPEYFVFDVRRRSLRGWRLPPGGGSYGPIVPQGGFWRSEVLGAELSVREDQLRFFADAALLPISAEMERALAAALDAALARAEEEARRAEGEARRAEGEARRAEEESKRADRAEAENAELRAIIAKLRGEGPPEG